MARYALYYAPPRDDPFWSVGVRWLGRDPETGETLSPPTVHGLESARQQQLTEAPRRYGWHATFKAPFALGEGLSLEDLMAELERFCSRHRALPLPPLAVAALDGFLAVIPSKPSGMLAELARECVEFFDPLRAPQSAAERSSRNPAALSERQRAYLDRWGYPYVLEEYRFHLTLTERLAPADHAVLLPWLERYFAAALAMPAVANAVALFEEPSPDAPLRLLRRVRFSGG